MRGSVKKSALILGVLLLSIAAAGQVFPGRDSQADVPVVTERVLVPGGQSVRVRMDVRGVLVVGLEEIENETGEKINPGLVSGLQIGDTILSINGTKVSSADEVQTLVNEIRDTVKLKVKRNGQKMTVTVKPVLSKKDGLYKLGIWVKDKTAGIGTLTYYDPANNTFGALGHGIVDVETNSILPVESGQLLQSQVQEVKEGRDGSPGATGATPRFTVTAVTGEAGTAASVTQSGTAENPMVEFTIPQGMKGDTGAQGEKGEKGEPGKDAPHEVVLYTAQTLSDAQKTQARVNIGAADAATVSSLKDEIEKKYSTEVLWENAAPNSAFDEQTITFDWKGYNYCMIYFLAYVASNVRSFSAVAKKGDRLRFYFLTDTEHGAGGQYRDFSSDTNHFGKAVRLTDSTSDDQRACIPIRIYGVKGV